MRTFMNMEITTIPDFVWNLWLEIMKQKGCYVLKYSKKIVLDFLIERRYLKAEREDTGMSTSEIMELIQNNSKIKSTLPVLPFQ